MLICAGGEVLATDRPIILEWEGRVHQAYTDSPAARTAAPFLSMEMSSHVERVRRFTQVAQNFVPVDRIINVIGCYP